MNATTNADQMIALQGALVAVASELNPEEVQTLASSVIEKIQHTADTAHISTLTRAFTAISVLLMPDNARALAEPIRQTIKGEGDPKRRHALGSALSAISSQLKPEELGLWMVRSSRRSWEGGLYLYRPITISDGAPRNRESPRNHQLRCRIARLLAEICFFPIGRPSPF